MNRLVLLIVLCAACGSVSAPKLVDAEVVTGTLEITPPMVTGKHGLTDAQLKATLHLSTGENRDVTDVVEWSTTADTTATVSAAGLVHLSGAGTATITGNYKTLSGTVSVTSTDPEMFLTDEGALSVDVFGAYASGSVAPTRQISGTNTTLSFPWSISVVQDEIFVSDVSTNAIDVWPLMTVGNVAPMRQIKGATTTLQSPYGMTVHGDEIFVASVGKVLVFPRTGTGNIAPIRTITGATTQLTSIITSIKVIDNELYVVGNGTIAVFPLMANGDVAPTRRIAGTYTSTQTFYEVAPGSNGELLVGGGPGVRVYTNSTMGDVAPLRYITGPDADLQNVTGVLLLDHEIYGLDATLARLSIHTETGTGDETPVRSLFGAATTLNSPRCLTVY